MIELGATVRIGEHEYVVMHITEDGSLYYCALKDVHDLVLDDIPKSDWVTYADIASQSWFKYEVPLDVAEYCVGISAEDSDKKCGVMQDSCTQAPNTDGSYWCTSNKYQLPFESAVGVTVPVTDDRIAIDGFRPWICIRSEAFEKGLIKCGND